MQTRLARSQINFNGFGAADLEDVKVAVRAGLGHGISLRSYVLPDIQNH